MIGLAVGGSWLTNGLDEFSDLDLILVTRKKISDDKHQWIEDRHLYLSTGSYMIAITNHHLSCRE
ncbi:MAG: hypothetical protein ITG04_13040 [Proteiniphilum sp.]|nr:hypothetical protein [Proteiniphilum sp.]